MNRRGIIERLGGAIALLAVVLFSSAAVRSTVMQAEMAAPASAMSASMPMCGGGGEEHGRRGSEPSGKAAQACAFCSAAAHAPVFEPAPVFSPPTAVAWAVYALMQPLGPRGPPEVAPKAQGPPAPRLTV